MPLRPIAQNSLAVLLAANSACVSSVSVTTATSAPASASATAAVRPAGTLDAEDERVAAGERLCGHQTRSAVIQMWLQKQRLSGG